MRHVGPKYGVLKLKYLLSSLKLQSCKYLHAYYKCIIWVGCSSLLNLIIIKLQFWHYRTKNISPSLNYTFLVGAWFIIYLFLKWAVVGRWQKIMSLSSVRWVVRKPSQHSLTLSSAACPCTPSPSPACTRCTRREVPAECTPLFKPAATAEQKDALQQQREQWCW